MNKTKQPWYKSTWFIAPVILLLVWATPIVAYQTYYFVARHIDDGNVVVEVAPELGECSHEEIREVVEVAKDAFHEEFPYSRLDKIKTGFCTDNRVTFVIYFRPGIFDDNGLSTLQSDGTALFGFTFEKTEQGQWKYIGYSSGW